MGELSSTMEEFKEISKEYYEKLIEILNHNYCWKCPMKSTSSKTYCREVDAWIRLTNSLEMGINEHLNIKIISKEKIEVIAAKFLEKTFKADQKTRYSQYHLLKIKEEIGPEFSEGSILVLKRNPKSIKSGDMVLIPEFCPLSVYWFSKIEFLDGLPFKISEVVKSYQKGTIKYIETKEGLNVPLNFIVAVIVRNISKDDPLYSELGLM
jgi:hypothetical protein